MTETYNVYRDDQKVADGLSAKSFKDTGLTPATAYRYTLDKTSADVAVGGTLKLTPTVSPTNATDKSGSWSSSVTAVATVSGGTVTVKGDAEVGATTDVTFTTNDGGKKATCTITVVAAEEG